MHFSHGSIGDFCRNARARRADGVSSSVATLTPLRRAVALGLALVAFAGTRASHADAPSSPGRLERSERALAREATLPEIIEIALARSPELDEAAARARATRSLASAASRLPEPEFEYQLWAAPLARPYALDRAEMHMFALRQTFPAPGSLRARSEAVAAQADIASSVERARSLELMARVRRAYAEYRRAESEYRIHLDHARLEREVLELVQATYQAGRGGQQDVLRAMVELSRREADLATIDRDRRSARALLNTLMARPLEAPLGPPTAPPPEQLEAEFRSLMQKAEPQAADHRPEVAAAESAVRASQAELRGARSMARWPSVMVGIQYMYMPPEPEPHNYGVLMSMSLPWLNPRYAEEVDARAAAVAAERGALSAARFGARYQLYEATRRLEAARQALATLDRDVVPRAESSVESARAVYVGGQDDALALFDAVRTRLDVWTQRARAQEQFEMALADVELGLAIVPDSEAPPRGPQSTRRERE